jgi:eukaryotic-like serine/threonine-protein kinase
VVERAGRPDPAERSTAAELGQGLIAAAEKLPRPAPLALVATSATLGSRDATAIGARTSAAVPAGAALGSPAMPSSSGRPMPSSPVLPPQPAPAAATIAVAPMARSELYDQDAARPHRTLRAFLIVLAVLAASALLGIYVLVFHKASTTTHPVEDLVGLQVGEARNRVATNGWNVTEVRQKNDSQPLDVVFKTDPASGDLAEGKSFVLYVSDGPTPSVLPNLVGMPVDQATATLNQLQLPLVVAGQQFSETAPLNTIVAFTVAGQAVPAGASVDKGSTVDVIVSAGPEPRTIPQLTGLPPDQVEQALRGLGLVPVRGDDVFDSVVPAGMVAASNPPQGAQVARDSTVTYQVSKGADLVTVPNMNLFTLQQATNALAAAGLTVGPITGDPSRVVVASSPPFGSQAPRGSAVGLTFY